MSNSVVVIGAGRMGSGIISTLLKKEYHVTVFDPSQAAIERVREMGAGTFDSIEEAVSQGRTVLMSLPGPQQVRETVERIGLSAAGNVEFIIDFSTIDPKTAKEMAATCQTFGIQYVEAPVSGGPGGAQTGTLSIMVGTTEAAFAKVEPVLRDVGKNIYYLGEAGNASIAKICNNIVVATTASVLGEAFLLASAGGIAPDKLKNVLENSVGGSRTLDVFGNHIVSGDYEEATFSLGLMHKDVGLYMEAIREYNITSFVGSLAYQLYNGAMAQGWGNEDHSVVCRYLEHLNHKSIDKPSEEGIQA